MNPAKQKQICTCFAYYFFPDWKFGRAVLRAFLDKKKWTKFVYHLPRGWFNMFCNRDTKIDLKMRRNMMNQAPISKRIVCQNEDTPFWHTSPHSNRSAHLIGVWQNDVDEGCLPISMRRPPVHLCWFRFDRLELSPCRLICTQVLHDYSTRQTKRHLRCFLQW